MGQNWEYNILSWDVHNTYTETSQEKKTTIDKIKKKTILVLTKSAYISYQPPPPPPTPLVCLFCVWSEINTTISYKSQVGE